MFVEWTHKYLDSLIVNILLHLLYLSFSCTINVHTHIFVVVVAVPLRVSCRHHYTPFLNNSTFISYDTYSTWPYHTQDNSCLCIYPVYFLNCSNNIFIAFFKKFDITANQGLCIALSRHVSTFEMGFPSGSAGKESACNVGDPGSIPGLGRSPGEGRGYPVQYSGLESSMGSQRVWD